MNHYGLALARKNSWYWGPDQEKAFMDIKTELIQPTILALYDPKAQIKVSADASCFGLGAALFQKHGDDWQPVAYASQVMCEAESHYAQIEKESLAATWACEKFNTYLLGLSFTIETNHKPLVPPLLNSKGLSTLPPRIIRFHLRLLCFTYAVVYVPGKLLYTADTLSRSLSPQTNSSVDIVNESCLSVQEFVSSVIAGLPASQFKLDEYRQAQREDPICQQIKNFNSIGWSNRDKVNLELHAYWGIIFSRGRAPFIQFLNSSSICYARRSTQQDTPGASRN